jgi:hypothetical protein
MKLLTDFDGVWTFPHAEGLAQGEALEARLLGMMPEPRRAEVAAWLRTARAQALSEPTRYGWLQAGRLSAFADEDPFIVHSALLHYIEARREHDEIARSLLDAVAASEIKSLDALGGESHAEGVRRVVESRGPGILPEAAEAGRRMLSAGVEVVAVSNSTTEKLRKWFDHAGVPCTEHPERKAGALRIRGSARKFVLAPDLDRALELGSLRIDLARPSYLEVLQDEKPGAIVGDVFSLDLALPLALRRTEPGWSRVRLFWILHPYTPAWLAREVAAHAPEIEPIRGGLPKLAEILVGSSADQGRS